jgi:hypothetical protein
MHGTQFCRLKGGHEEEESMSYRMLLHLTSALLSKVFAHIGLVESDANLHVMLQGRRMYRGYVVEFKPQNGWNGLYHSYFRIQI